MKRESPGKGKSASPAGRGIVAWLLSRLRRGDRARPRLCLLERIALAPRQTLALVEAEGRRFLVATSPEGGPAFYALDERTHQAGKRAGHAARISW
jgi:flagellar biogenesis protein FliO